MINLEYWIWTWRNLWNRKRRFPILSLDLCSPAVCVNILRPINDSIIVGFGEVPVGTSKLLISRESRDVEIHFFYFSDCREKIRTSIRFGYLVWKQDFYQTAFWNSGWIDFWEKMVLVFYFDILYFSVSELVSTSLVGIWTDLWSFIHVFKHLWRLLKS